MYDILILGGGPAGLSAAVAARQKNRTVLVIGNASASNPLSGVRSGSTTIRVCPA